MPVGAEPRHEVVCTDGEIRDYYRRLDQLGATRALFILKEGYSDGTFLNQGCGAAQTVHVNADGAACQGAVRLNFARKRTRLNSERATAAAVAAAQVTACRPAAL